MSPFTAEAQPGLLCQDVVALAPPMSRGMPSEARECHHHSAAEPQVLAHRADEEPVEQVCGTALRLEEVLQRFRREAVLGSVDTGRYRCKYYSWGSGPPLVFVHGLGDDAVSFVMPIARLSEHFRCIAYEQPRGAGDRAHLGKYHHADLVADLFVLIDHLKLPTADVLGCSFGSTIALSAMHRQPGRFPRGILLSGFARRPLATAEIMLASWARYWPWKMNMLPMRESAMKHTHFPPFAHRQPELWQFFLDRDGAIPMEAVARRALILNQIDLRPILPEIKQPILMVCGENDPLVGKRCEQELIDGLAGARRVELAGCGHEGQFTHPEAVAEVVRRFLHQEPQN